MIVGSQEGGRHRGGPSSVQSEKLRRVGKREAGTEEVQVQFSQECGEEKVV